MEEGLCMLQKKEILFIQIGKEAFAVEINQVKRFVTNVEISDCDIKDKAPIILGMICTHDEVIPVLDLYKWFRQESIHLDESTVFVVVTCEGKSFAFPIDDVIMRCEVSDKCFHAVPAVFRKESGNPFREVIDWNGKLYLKISGEIISKGI